MVNFLKFDFFVFVFNGVENFFISVAVIVSFLDQFGPMVFNNDKPPIMTDLMEWISNQDEGELINYPDYLFSNGSSSN